MKLRGSKLLLAAILISCTVLTGPAWAGTITFSGNSRGQGKLSFSAGIGHTLTVAPGGGGSGALIDDLLAITGACSSGCGVTGGYLVLTSGGETGVSGGTYSFGSGGSIDIYGAIPSLGITNPHTRLMSASFTSEQLSTFSHTGTFTGNLNLSSIYLNPAIGTYSYNEALSEAITLALSGTCNTHTGCSGLVTTAFATLQTTPEPASLSLLGTGLLAVGCFLRKKLL